MRHCGPYEDCESILRDLRKIQIFLPNMNLDVVVKIIHSYNHTYWVQSQDPGCLTCVTS